MKKSKKAIIALSVVLVLGLIFVAGARYMMKRHVSMHIHETFSTEGANDASYETLNVRRQTGLKLHYDIVVKEGSMTVGLYYLPEDHILRQAKYWSPAEQARMIESGQYGPESYSVDGLECVYEQTMSQDGSFVIDLSSFRDGIYLLCEKYSDDGDLYGSMSLEYATYNWMRWKVKITGRDDYDPIW